MYNRIMLKSTALVEGYMEVVYGRLQLECRNPQHG